MSKSLTNISHEDKFLKNIKSLPDIAVTTRQQRRKSLSSLIRQLETILAAEQRYLSRMPENFQTSCRYEDAEKTVDALEEAVGILHDAF